MVSSELRRRQSAFPGKLEADIRTRTGSDRLLPEPRKNPAGWRWNHLSSSGLLNLVSPVREDPARCPVQLHTFRIGNGGRHGDFRNRRFRRNRCSHDTEGAREGKGAPIRHGPRDHCAGLQRSRGTASAQVFATGFGWDLFRKDHQMERSRNLRSEPGGATARQQHCRHP